MGFLALSAALCMSLTIPVGAYGAGTIHQRSIITTGQYYSGLVKGDGSLWMTGTNSEFQLGTGEKTTQRTPVHILDHVYSVSVGVKQTAAILSDNTLWIWGFTQNRKLDKKLEYYESKPRKVMDQVAAVSCGDWYTAVIKTDGTLWTWGINNYGQLGNGIIGEERQNPWLPGDLWKPKKIDTVFCIMDDVVSVSCGDIHTAALKKDGTMWTWGSNYNGRLGIPGLDTDTAYPTPMKVMDDVVSINCGDDYTAAIKTDGSLWMWGSNYAGSLGIGEGGNSLTQAGDPFQSTPVKVMDDVVAVSCGAQHTAAIKTDGSLWMWGSNQDGLIGIASEETSIKKPVKVLDDVVAVSCGYNHTIAVRSDGTLWGWGESTAGQLANGGTGNRSYEIPEIPAYPSPIPARTVYYQDVPVQVWDLAYAKGTLPSMTPPAIVGEFLDVWESDYYADPVEWAVDNGITSGTSDSTFSPDHTCTTAQILTFLWKANGAPQSANPNPFTDVSEEDYYYQAALWAAENGLVSSKALEGNSSATRADTVMYLWTLAGKPEAAPADFSDVPANAAYAQAVAWAVQEGITSGTGDTTFSPDSICTRGQIMTFLYRDVTK